MNPWRMRRTIRGLFFLLLFGLLGLAVQAGTNISHSSDTESWGPRITVDSAGNIYCVWLEQYSLTTGDVFYSKCAKSTGTWSTPINLSESGLAASNVKESYRIADLGVDGADNVYCAWAEKTAVKFRVLGKDGWGATTTLASGKGVDSPRMGVTATGNIYIAWMSGFRILGRARINGVWETTRQISGSKAAKNPGIDAGPNWVYCVFNEKQPNDYRIAWSRRTTTLNSAWSATALIYKGPIPQTMPVVKVDSSNVPYCIYLDEASDGVRTARYSKRSGAAFTKPIVLSVTACLHYPAMSRKGANIYGLWQSGAWGNGQAIRTNFMLAGKWKGESSVPDSKGCTYGDIEVDASGNTHIVWDSNGEIYYVLLASR